MTRGRRGTKKVGAQCTPNTRVLALHSVALFELGAFLELYRIQEPPIGATVTGLAEASFEKL